MIKRTITAIVVCSSVTACAATTATSTTATSSYPNIQTIPSPTQLQDSDKVITLEKIMSDPDWIGRQPKNAYWGDDSSTVYYQRKRQGNELRDWYQQAIASAEAKTVSLAEQHNISRNNSVYSSDGKYNAYVFSGDVFVKDLTSGQLHQVTRTAAAESAPQFLTDGRLAYRLGDNFFTWRMIDNSTAQLVDLKLTDKPTGIKAPSSYLAKEQHKLLKFVAKTHQDAQNREDHKKKLKQANQHIFKQSWYLGKDNQIVDASLSPNGQWLVVALQKDSSWRDDGDIMPNYITQDGTIEAKNARRRVADIKPQKQQIMLLNLQNHSQHELKYDTLPGWDEDVLAAVKTENHQAQGKTYQSKPQPRLLGIINYGAMKWNASGDKLAMMLVASDNKDRWLASVDFDSHTLRSEHRYHDEAWVNYAHNDFGWFNHSDSLYWLSEQSGFSHLYLLNNGKVKALTHGSYEVSKTTLSNDDQYIYFTANKKHPGIYETYRVNTQTAALEQLTDMHGRNDYTLSPDGKKLLLVHSQVAMPPELYIKAVNSPSKAKRLTYTVSDEFLSYNWNTPAIVPVKSSQASDPVFSKVYYPKDVQSGVKRKAAMFVHGAGYTQNADTGWAYYFREFMFNSMLAQQGYVVIDMDYRASKGYGRDWRTAIYRNMGTPELADFVDGVDWMVENANVDRNKVAVYGGSYGGFMTLMALFKQPDLFQAGAAIRLVSDWAHYNTGYTSNILNTPQDDPIAYERSSPIYFAEGLTKPLLINAPMLDDNVFFQDTVRLVQRMIELEKETFETAIYPVEPHGFRQPSSWLDEYRRIYKLFETNL